jgi:hypothetical protein
LVIILSWIDDNLIVGSKQAVAVTKQELMSRFDCEDCGELDEYVGCRLTRNKGEIKFTQGVLVQSFEDEFDVPKKMYATPAKPGNILTKGDPNSVVDAKTQTYLQVWGRQDDSHDAMVATGHVQRGARSYKTHSTVDSSAH